jgi:hypothetical protein
METVITDAKLGNNVETIRAERAMGIGASLMNIGIGVLRYGLVGILFYYGFAKFLRLRQKPSSRLFQTVR